MFETMKPLSKETHAKLKFSPAPSYAFARQMTSAPLTIKELPDACKIYPIVFPTQNAEEVAAGYGPLPVALFSLLKDSNAFIDETGIWNARYLPAYVRRYPFSLAKTGVEDGQFAVVIDEGAPHFGNKGKMLFTKGGKASKHIEQMTTFLTNLQSATLQTQKLTVLLEQHELLKPQQISYGKEDEQKGLRSFRVIDEEKLHKIDDALLAVWTRNGLISLVMAHLFSLGNMNVLAERHGAEALSAVGSDNAS